MAVSGGAAGRGPAGGPASPHRRRLSTGEHRAAAGGSQLETPPKPARKIPDTPSRVNDSRVNDSRVNDSGA